jgi:hypothetical protein
MKVYVLTERFAAGEFAESHVFLGAFTTLELAGAAKAKVTDGENLEIIEIKADELIIAFDEMPSLGHQ